MPRLFATLFASCVLCLSVHARANPDDLDGLWAAHFQLATATKVPIIGDLISRTHQWALLDARSVDGRIDVLQTVCSVQILNPAMTSVVPEAWVRSIPPRTWQATVMQTEVGAFTLTADLGVAITGYDPEVGALPASASDPATIDQDNDGHPGVTLRVKPFLGSWGEVYIASRTQWKLTAPMGRDLIAGTMQVADARQAVLGASSGLLMRKTESRPVPDASHFAMQRLPVGSTCDDVVRIAQADGG